MDIIVNKFPDDVIEAFSKWMKERPKGSSDDNVGYCVNALLYLKDFYNGKAAYEITNYQEYNDCMAYLKSSGQKESFGKAANGFLQSAFKNYGEFLKENSLIFPADNDLPKFKNLLKWFVTQLNINNEVIDGEKHYGTGYKDGSSLRQYYYDYREYDGFTLDCRLGNNFTSIQSGANYINKTETSLNINPKFDENNKVSHLYLSNYGKRLEEFNEDYSLESLQLDGEIISESLTVLFNNFKKLINVFSQKEVKISSVFFNTGYNASQYRNRIVFGAPGTGKSYTLNKDKDELLGITANNELGHGGAYERVTFHSDYTYSQFVGTYKPVSSEENKISYEFVPGPFMRILVKAYGNIIDAYDEDGQINVDLIRPFVLIIEELNRAKTAAVFGDIFQLLDRGEDNISEYDIQISQDIQAYLQKELKINVDRIKLPDNLFIWCTMNSADQGVFPLDTAFKRRWNFEYIGIDDEELDENKAEVQTGKFNIANEEIQWNILRRAINAKLSDDVIKLHEDKLMGPFFIKTMDSNHQPIDDKKFIELFCGKVLMYLFEDAAKTKRTQLFEGVDENINRYSHICSEFKKKGIKIFGMNFRENYYEKQAIELSNKMQ